MDERLDDILLMSAHDCAAHVRFVCLGAEVPRVPRVAVVFERDKVVLLVAGHVVETRRAPGRIDLPRAWVDKLRPCLVHGVPVLAELLPLQPACVFRRGRLSFVLRWRLQFSWMFR